MEGACGGDPGGAAPASFRLVCTSDCVLCALLDLDVSSALVPTCALAGAAARPREEAGAGRGRGQRQRRAAWAPLQVLPGGSLLAAPLATTRCRRHPLIRQRGARSQMQVLQRGRAAAACCGMLRHHAAPGWPRPACIARGASTSRTSQAQSLHSLLERSGSVRQLLASASRQATDLATPTCGVPSGAGRETAVMKRRRLRPR